MTSLALRVALADTVPRRHNPNGVGILREKWYKADGKESKTVLLQGGGTTVDRTRLCMNITRSQCANDD